MALPTATEVAQRWAQQAGAASQRYVDGARAVTVDPTQLAIQAIPRMRTRILEAIDTGRVQAGLQRAGRAGWLAGIEGKGASNYASGVSAAQSKVEAAFGPLLSHIAAGQSRLASMPANTDAERDARLLFFVNHMRAYRPPS